MKIILFSVLLFAITCQGTKNTEGKQKKKEALSFIYLLPFLLPVPSTKYISPVRCGITSSILKTNLKMIEIYHNSSFLLSNPINSTSIYAPNFCDPMYYILRFEENSKLIAIRVYYKEKNGKTSYNYTGVELYLKDNTFKEYTMNFNGDPDTFTEFTAGEYRFVAVR